MLHIHMWGTLRVRGTSPAPSISLVAEGKTMTLLLDVPSPHEPLASWGGKLARPLTRLWIFLPVLQSWKRRWPVGLWCLGTFCRDFMSSFSALYNPGRQKLHLLITGPLSVMLVCGVSAQLSWAGFLISPFWGYSWAALACLCERWCCPRPKPKWNSLVVLKYNRHWPTLLQWAF